MPNAKLRAIIFDIGRVLIRVDISRSMNGLASGLTLTPQEVWSAIEKDPHWLDWQEGRISPRDWHLHLTKRLGTSLTFEEFSEVWNRALDPNPIHTEAFLEKLSKSYRLALLSNTDPIHMSHEEARFPFFRFFPRPRLFLPGRREQARPNYLSSSPPGLQGWSRGSRLY